MLLAVDTGNSTICFAVFDNDKIIYSWKIITNKDKESDYYSTVLKENSSGLFVYNPFAFLV